MARSRPCWVTQAESGPFVTPARWTLLVPTSMQNRTYSVFSWTVSRVKKSQAMIPQAWAQRNWLHVEPLRLVGDQGRRPQAASGWWWLPCGCPACGAPLESSGSPTEGSPGHAHDEPAHLQIDRWSPGLFRSRVGPLASYELRVPAQQLRRDEKHCPPVPGQDPAGGGEQDAVECGESGTASLATQHTELPPQHQDLQVLGAVSSAWQDQHAGDRADDQRDQEQHRPMVRSRCSRCESGFRAPQAVSTALGLRSMPRDAA